MIEDIKLFNRISDSDVTNQTPFNSSADINFDENGNFVKCENSDEGIEQNLLKAVLTNLQIDGYGTDIVKLIGSQNHAYIKGKMLNEVTTAISVLKKYQMDFYKDNPTYNKKSIINDILYLYVTDYDKTSIDVDVKIQSYYDYLKNQLSLKPIQININNN